MDATWRRRISPLRVEQLAREGFDEAQPYLTGGGVGGHGVTQPMDGDARSDSDGGGVDELTRTRAHEGGSQHGPRLPVDDELGLTVGIVAQEGSSSSRGVTDLGGDDVVVEGPGPLLGQAAGGELGIGEDDLRDRDALGHWFGLAARRMGGDPLPHNACSVLAYVGQLGLTTGVADGVEPVGQATGQDVVGLQADGLQPYAGQ